MAKRSEFNQPGKALKIQNDLFNALVLIAESRHNYYCVLNNKEIDRHSYEDDDFGKILYSLHDLREKMKTSLEKQLFDDIKKLTPDTVKQFRVNNTKAK
jgi:hypothetical protein